MKLLEKIFSVTNKKSKKNKWHKVIYILGIKLAFRNKAKEKRIAEEKERKELKATLKLLQKQNKELKQEIKSKQVELQKQNKELKQEIKSKQVELQKQNKELKQELIKSQCLYNTNKPRFLMGLEGTEILSIENFEERFLKMVENLSEDSVTTLVSILKRIQLVNGTTGNIDLFSEEEKSLLKDIQNKKKHILKISDNRFVYQNYFLPINHFESSVFYYKHGLHLLDNLDYFSNKAIIDVGAFIGDSACILSPYTNDKVYCFEAVKENYDYMQQTIEMNNLHNIIPEKLALGDKDGEFEIRVMSSGSSIDPMMVSQPTSIEKCSVTTLDNYIQDKNIEVGLIKVDIEGAEQLFLQGAINTIKKHKPTMLISIYHNISDFLDIKPMIESWNLGYKFKIFKPTNGGVCSETLLICEI